MKKTKTLKEQNSKLVWTFFSFNAILFYVLSFSPEFDISKSVWKEFVLGRGIWLFVVPLTLFIINGLLSSNQKAIICFWKIYNPLPACRAFSVYAKKDDRINNKMLETKFAPLPETAKDQNSLWYKIYKTHQKDPIINKSHKDFLLGRDICSMAFLYLIIGGVLGLFLISGSNKFIYIGFESLQYLILVIVTQNYGKRFVCNVLAIETSK